MCYGTPSPETNRRTNEYDDEVFATIAFAGGTLGLVCHIFKGSLLNFLLD